MQNSDRLMWVGWVTRILLWALGSLLIKAGWSEDQLTGLLSPVAELIVGLGTFGMATAWSWWHKRSVETPSAVPATLKALLPLALGALLLVAAGCQSVSPQRAWYANAQAYSSILTAINGLGEAGVISPADGRRLEPVAVAARTALDAQAAAAFADPPATDRRAIDQVNALLDQLIAELHAAQQQRPPGR
jgi:hypothetical protein